MWAGCRRGELGRPWAGTKRYAERGAALWLRVSWGECGQDSFRGACHMVELPARYWERTADGDIAIGRPVDCT